MISRILLATVTLIMLGCQGESRVCSDHGVNFPEGNAGCWVTNDASLLMIRQRSGKYSFPGGTAEPGETARCTAQRETWEETGVDVEVTALKHRFDNGFYLFDCRVLSSELGGSDWLEVSEVLWIDPQDIPAEKWRFPYQRELTLRWLQRD